MHNRNIVFNITILLPLAVAGVTSIGNYGLKVTQFIKETAPQLVELMKAPSHICKYPKYGI